MGVRAPLWQDVKGVIMSSLRQIRLEQIKPIIDISDLRIFADPLFYKIFYNLADNAKRYGEKITEIRYYARETQDGTVLSIEDDGVGILSDKKKRNFKP